MEKNIINLDTDLIQINRFLFIKKYWKINIKNKVGQ
jgi:hypothetical protein